MNELRRKYMDEQQNISDMISTNRDKLKSLFLAKTKTTGNRSCVFKIQIELHC